jgi:hypothetical protein
MKFCTVAGRKAVQLEHDAVSQTLSIVKVTRGKICHRELHDYGLAFDGQFAITKQCSIGRSEIRRLQDCFCQSWGGVGNKKTFLKPSRLLGNLKKASALDTVTC